MSASITRLKREEAAAPVYNSRLFKRFSYHLLVGGLALLMLYPILWLAASSLKPADEIFTRAYSLIPSRLELSNYATGWRGFGGTSFGIFFQNSLIISVLATIGAVASSALVAYALARIPFVGQKFWFGCVMMTLMLPGDVTVISQYILFSKLGWLSSFKPIILPNFFGVPFFIFLIMQFIRTIPTEMDEAAKIDGSSKYGIFFKIILPLIVPSMVTATIFSFYWRWDDFFQPLLYLNNPSLYPVSLALKLFLDAESLSNWGGLLAMSTLSLLPIVLVFLFFQKYIVEGISTSGLKG